MIEDVCDILEVVVNSIDNTIEGTNIAPGVATFCDTKWARVPKRLVRVSDGEEWVVTDVLMNEQITATYLGTTIPEPTLEGIFGLPIPYWITGTRLAANNEWRMVTNDVAAKTPIIWLHETIMEVIYGREASLERSSEIRLFFLDETNTKDYYTKDHRKFVVNPMQQLVDAFIGAINENSQFKNVESYRMKTFSRFGFEQEQGVMQNILDSDLSGVELQFTLEKFKINCKC